jgi:hypothetical protein
VVGTEVHQRDAGHSLAQFNFGPFPAQIAAVLDTFANYPGEYEARLLRIPALHVEALWLKSADAAWDRLVPLSPAPPPLRPGDVYEADLFFGEIEPQANESLRFDNTPRVDTAGEW